MLPRETKIWDFFVKCIVNNCTFLQVEKTTWLCKTVKVILSSFTVFP